MHAALLGLTFRHRVAHEEVGPRGEGVHRGCVHLSDVLRGLRGVTVYHVQGDDRRVVLLTPTSL